MMAQALCNAHGILTEIPSNGTMSKPSVSKGLDDLEAKEYICDNSISHASDHTSGDDL